MVGAKKVAAFFGRLALAGALLSAGPAFAEGHKKAEEVDPWPGFYAGLHIGNVLSTASGTMDHNDPVGEFSFDPIDPKGFSIGGQAGYLWRMKDRIAAGIEADITYVNASDRTGILDTKGKNPNKTKGAGFQYGEAELKGFGSLRGRIGVIFDRFMPYATAGVGFVSYKFTYDDEGGGSGGGGKPGFFETSETAIAPVIGGGIEWLATDDISIKFEGLYYFVNDKVSLDGVVPDSDKDTGQHFKLENIWTLRAAISFKF